MRYGELNYPISKIIKRKLNNKKKYTFIDIGANVGLVSRQLFFENKNIENYICVEPTKMTFDCLAKNTSLLKKVSLHNIGLGQKNETKNIFIDKSNHGNASLEKTMMSLSKYKNYKVEKITVMSVKSFFNLIKKDIKGKKLIIKIDTQSLDELIISLIPDEIIKNTVLLNYELTSVEGVRKQKISVENFKLKLSKFKKIWSEDINNINSDWLAQNYESSGNRDNIETDIYLMK
jgi:FkbM family methyltransferase